MIRDDASGFAIDLAAPNASTCVVEPSAQFDPAACKGIDPAPIHAAIAKGQTAQKVAIVVATIRRDDFSYDVMALRQSYARASKMTPQQLDGFVRAAAKGVHDQLHHDVTAKAFDGDTPKARDVGGMSALSMILAPEGADAPPVRVVSWSFFADDAIVTVSFVTDAAHVDVVRADSEKIASTVDWPAARKAHAHSTFARPQASTSVVTQLVVASIVVALFVAIVWLLRRRRRPRGA